MEEKLYCYGCGHILQCEDETQAGYVPDKILETKDNILCQRCFKLQHYNTNSEIQLVEEDYINILKNIASKDALLVYVLDIFNFESSLINDLNKYLGNNKILVLANKRDLIPSSVKDEKLLGWIKTKLSDNKINNVIDIIMSSGQTNYNTDFILDKINQLRDGKDVYIIGNANVGKSTFINSLLKNYSNETDKFITTSSFPGTTLNVIRIPLDMKSYIYDTPGIIQKNSMLYSVEPKILKHILPRKEIKPITYQLKDGQSLFVGGLATFDFIKGEETGFTCYFSTFVKVHRTKLEKKEVSFNSVISSKSIQPISNRITSFDNLTLKKIELNKPGKVDIVISGYGWISFEYTNQEIEVYAPKNCSVYIREALI
jgi:ribosome biogenesis GTPase YqeH